MTSSTPLIDRLLSLVNLSSDATTCCVTPDFLAAIVLDQSALSEEFDKQLARRLLEAATRVEALKLSTARQAIRDFRATMQETHHHEVARRRRAMRETKVGTGSNGKVVRLGFSADPELDLKAVVEAIARLRRLVHFTAAANSDPADLAPFERLPHVIAAIPTLEVANLCVLGGSLWAAREIGDEEENFRKAIACFQAGLNVVTPANAPDLWLEIHNNLGLVMSRRRHGDKAENEEKAIEHFETALETKYSLDAISRSRIHNNLGLLYKDRIRGSAAENLEKSIFYCELALADKSPKQNAIDWAETTANLGLAHLYRHNGNRKNNIERAIELLEQALATGISLGDPGLPGHILNGLGIAFTDRIAGDRIDNQECALIYFQRALDASSREQRPFIWAEMKVNLGNLLLQRIRGEVGRNTDEAIDAYRAALEVRTPEVDVDMWALTQSNLAGALTRRAGFTRERSGEYDLAIELLKEIAARLPEDRRPKAWAEAQGGLGDAYFGRKGANRAEELVTAIDHYKAQQRVSTREDAPYSWADAQASLGRIHFEQAASGMDDRYELAVACLNDAVTILEDANPAGSLRAMVDLGQVFQHRGDVASARKIWHAALNSREQQFMSAIHHRSRGSAADASRNLSSMLALLEAKTGNYNDAVLVLERGRGQTLRETLGTDPARMTNLPENVRMELTAASELVRSLTYALAADGQKDRRQTASMLASARRSLSARAKLAGLAPAAPLDAKSLCALAPPGGAIVALAVAPDGALAIVLPHGLAEVRKEHCLILTEANGRYLHDLRWQWLSAYIPLVMGGDASETVLSRANHGLKILLDGLWTRLVGPVRDRLQHLGLHTGSSLQLLLQGQLATLPVHAACPLDGSERSFLDQYVVSYAPSGTQIAVARDQLKRLEQRAVDGQNRPKTRIFGVFDPQTSSAPRLPAAVDAEMPALRSLFEAGQRSSATLLAGRHATLESVLEHGPKADYLHFACHGRFNLMAPEEAGLLLAGDQILSVELIAAELKLANARLVALSACESGMVDVTFVPDEHFGLPSAFLQAGTPGVLATFWSIFDAPTAKVVVDFYERHLKGMTPAAALREAVIELRDSASSFDQRGTGALSLAEPIFWAAYGYHGL